MRIKRFSYFWLMYYQNIIFITFNTLLMQILKGSHTFDLCIIKIVFLVSRRSRWTFRFASVRMYVRSYVPIFPKIRALEFLIFVLKNEKMSKKVTFSLFHRKFENGLFLAKNGPKSAFLAQNAQKWGFWAFFFKNCALEFPNFLQEA